MESTIEKKFWESKKWWAMAITTVVITIAAALGIDVPVETIVSGAMVIVGYILAQAHVDAKTRSAEILGKAASAGK